MVETIRLESGHTWKGIGGSNPPLSASSYHGPDLATEVLRLRLRISPAGSRSSLCCAEDSLTPAKRLKFESPPLRQKNSY